MSRGDVSSRSRLASHSWRERPLQADAASLLAMAAVATQLPWVEKYRPKSVDEVSHQPEVVASLKKSLEQKNLPCAGAIPRSPY